eukprot:5412518-Amphidinium_carterae.1
MPSYCDVLVPGLPCSATIVIWDPLEQKTSTQLFKASEQIDEPETCALDLEGCFARCRRRGGFARPGRSWPDEEWKAPECKRGEVDKNYRTIGHFFSAIVHNVLHLTSELQHLTTDMSQHSHGQGKMTSVAAEAVALASQLERLAARASAQEQRHPDMPVEHATVS